MAWASWTGSFDPVDLHVLLGLAIIALALAGSGGEATPLPPWDERLTGRERRLVTATERLLLVLLVDGARDRHRPRAGDDDLLPLHVAVTTSPSTPRWRFVAVVVRRRLVGRMLPRRSALR